MTKERFQLVAGHLALDFANTLDNRFDPERVLDLLGIYGDLLRFCEEAGCLSGRQSRRLARLGRISKSAALQVAGELRNSIEHIFSAAARNEVVSQPDLACLNGFVQKALGHRRVIETDGLFRWRWEGAEEEADSPLWPITLAAAELLTSEDLQFVRECQAETCRWLFLDLSKNHSRRWCDMTLCGNRNKARRYYEKRSEAR